MSNVRNFIAIFTGFKYHVAGYINFSKYFETSFKSHVTQSNLLCNDAKVLGCCSTSIANCLATFRWAVICRNVSLRNLMYDNMRCFLLAVKGKMAIIFCATQRENKNSR